MQTRAALQLNTQTAGGTNGRTMRTLLVDGNNLAWRAHHAIRAELTSGGKPVKVIYGFLRSLRDTLDKFDIDRCFVCWDNGEPKRRLSIYPEYKANRRSGIPMEIKERKDMFRQIAFLKKFLGFLGVNQVEHPDTEADDLIAAAAGDVNVQGLKIILSGDRDLLQLVQEHVWMYLPKHSYLYTLKNFKEKTGLTPQQYGEVRILAGDPTDNIPPVAKGLGEKTAKDLLLYADSLSELRHSDRVRKEIQERFSKRHNLFYTDEHVKPNLARNFILMQLGNVDIGAYGKFKATASCHKGKVKRIFFQHKFISILSEFGLWMQPFERLT